MGEEPTIVSQEESTGCWIFEIESSADASAPPRRHRLRLAWPDYDLYSPGGDAPPERVAMAVFRFLSERGEFAPLPERLDASWARRRVEGADRLIAERL